MFNIYQNIRKRYMTRSQTNCDVFENKLNEYKNTLNKQTIYTINEFIENVNLLYEDIKKSRCSLKLLNDVQEFQNIVAKKANDFMRFHREIR